MNTTTIVLLCIFGPAASVVVTIIVLTLLFQFLNWFSDWNTERAYKQFTKGWTDKK